MKASPPVIPAYTLESIEKIFNIQKANQYAVASSSARERIEKLNKFHRVFLHYRPAIKEALFLDFHKHPFEVDLTEIYTVTSELKHATRNLRRWMSKHRTSTPLSLLGSRSYIHYEPKGVVLIISPWNFPITLTFGPMIAAIAAGNTVILKPSEQTPHTASVMQQIVEKVFKPEEVVLLQGGIETSKSLLSLPFNHIFFTGSSRVGKIVMESAAKHLTSVTLELGGKSPTIIDETANIDAAARRIAWVKCINNGQICIAPDHVLVHFKVQEQFINSFNLYIKKFFGDDPLMEPSYARLVNKNHFEKVNKLLENAILNGAQVRVGGQKNEEEHYIEPTVLSHVPDSSDIMQEEIFGPVLPVISYQNISELISRLNQGEKPLALYIYSQNRKNIKQIIEGTRAGGTCINSSGVHFFNHHLPFGGSNFSGIGKGHGWFGFESFSNARAVYHQILPSALEILVPPYNGFKQKIINFAIKYL